MIFAIVKHEPGETHGLIVGAAASREIAEKSVQRRRNGASGAAVMAAVSPRRAKQITSCGYHVVETVGPATKGSKLLVLGTLVVKDASDERLVKATEGTAFTKRRYIDPARQYVETVGPTCKVTKGGVWYCLTHDETFANQLEKDMHIADDHGPYPKGTKHTLVWQCFEHGAEVP